MYLHRRCSRSGPNESANRLRVAEFIPSEATTRSYSALSAATSGASVRNKTRTPRAAQRACRIASSRLRLIAAKPCPPEVKMVLRRCTSMSSQRAKSRRMAEDLRVGVLDAAERLIREHHPEAERVVGGVAFPDSDLVPGVQLLGQGREVQAARTAT